MPEMLAVALEAAAVVLAFSAALFVAGYGLTRLLTRGALRSVAVPLMPAVGAAALIVGSYLLNLVVNLTVAVPVMLAAAVALDAWLIWRHGWWLPRPTRAQAFVWVAAAALLAVAFLPHLHGRSLAMLGLNIDEELYVPLAEMLKSNTVFMPDAAPGPFQTEFRGIPNHSRGWGFPYLLTIASLLANAPVFHTYVPVLYVLLALSVPAVFVFGRGGLGLSERTAALGAGLYALHGLPLWFSGMGFGPHTVSFLLFPVAIATGIVAVRAGGRGRLALAALCSAALLMSYFWAISAVYAAVAGLLAIALVAAGPGRRRRAARLLTLGLGTGLLAAPGLVWLGLFVAPLLRAIASDVNGQFGNAWGDIVFARVELAFGLAPYRLAADAGPLGDALGADGVRALTAAKDALFWPALVAAGVGLATMRGRRYAAAAMALAYAGFMLWVAKGAAYPYGHFKNLSYVAYFVAMLMAAGISNVFHMRYALIRQPDASRDASAAPGARAGRWLAVGLSVLLGAALVHNTYQTVWWYWSGVGWNLDRRIAHDARAAAARVPAGDRVYFAAGLEVPLPGERIVLREHVLGFHFPEHQVSSWTARTRGIWAAELSDRPVFGFAGSLAFHYRRPLAPDAYDAIVINTRDDPRTFGLLPADALYTTPYWTLYGIPQADRLTGDAIAAGNGGRLELRPDRALQIGLRGNSLAIGSDVAAAAAPIIVGLVTAQDAGVVVGSGAAAARIDLAPGLTWVTVPPDGALALTLGLDGFSPPVQVVVARLRRGNAGGGELTSEHVDAAIFSVDVRVARGRIEGSIVATNPEGLGRDIGMAYEESATRAGQDHAPRGAPARGFWRSSALVSAPAQEIDFSYRPETRELRESVNGGAAQVTVARPASGTAPYMLEARLAHGFVGDFSAPLIDFALRDGQVVDAIVFRRVYTPDLVSGR